MNNIMKKTLSILICLAMLLSWMPDMGIFAKAAVADVNVLSGSKAADPATLDGWEAYFGPNKMDTEFAGAVWTDKSVFTKADNALPGVALTDNGNFLVSLSAIASNLSITGHTSAPTDIMLVLDLSGSMVNGTYEVGTIRQGNQYRTANAIDMSLIEAMVDATNDTIDKMMKRNSNNRIGVVLYSGNAATNQAATPGDATVVLPLGRYNGVNGEYLSVDTTWTTQTLYTYRYYRWQASGSATYVAEGTNVNVSVRNGLTTEAGAAVTDTSKRANGGTYTQNGLYKALDQFLAVTDTTVDEGKPQAGAERLPVIVLMTDGAPTIATTSFNNIGNSNVGNGTTTDDKITFLTQLTAAYVRGRVSTKYQESGADEKEMLFLTLGLGTENSTAATNTLYPAGSNSTLVGYWDKYLAATAGDNVQMVQGNGGWSVYRDSAVEAMNYVDKYYYASDAQSLIDSFEEIVSQITIKADSYTTLVEGNGADLSGYVTFVDELGELMQVYNVAGILLGDTLFTGRELAKGMNDGNLGTVEKPNEKGDELVATVKERIPGTSTTQAQQLIGNAYMDQQLYYSDDSRWSNYIGWYADANGNYMGFWDKDSGYENAPAGAVYANKSYGYLGANGDSDMMHTVVMVRTDLKTLHQSVVFKIPAALLPTVQYNITLDKDDVSKVEHFEQETAEPMRLVFEVGVREDLNAVNLEQKIDEHIAKGGHVHRNSDDTVTLYTNEWAIGNDRNGNGIPDPEEVEDAVVTQSHFHPAMDNSRFYYTEDTRILTGNDGNVSGSGRPSGSGYYYNRYIYAPSGRTAIKTPIDAQTLANDAQRDNQGYWYIPSGTMYRGLARFQTPKAENATGTLSYSFFPAVFDAVNKQDVYTFLGNNGKLTLTPAQGIALTKTVAEVSQETDAPTEFTFTVTLSEAVNAPVITDTEGNALTNIASVAGNVITVKLTAGQTVVISGIPAGTEYTVEEQTTDYYKASSGNATGTVEAYTVHAVDFVNTAKHYGTLVVGKDVNFPAGFAPMEAHNAREFTVTVEFDGDIAKMVAPAGAVQDGSRFTLLLKNGQSATFANIPEGVTYTVTETGLPTGYSLHQIRYSDENKRIDGKDLDEVHVVNSYALEPVTPNVKIRGDKTLVTNESSWNGESFTVELLQLEHFADEDPVSTGLTATMTEADPTYEIDMSGISFSHVGTYYFRVVEIVPDNRNENIAYDRTFGLFSITAADEDADGKLEIKQVNAYQSTALSGNNADGWVVEKDFTNVVTTDRIYLDIQKHVLDADSGAVVDAHMGDITFGLFTAMSESTPAYYALTGTNGKATLMIPVTKEAIADAGGRIDYYLREIAPAVENRVVGMHYNESWIYAVAVTWDDVANEAVVEYAPITEGVVGEYAPYDGSFLFEHKNTLEANVKVSLDLSGKKTLNGGNALGGREFSFSLYHATAAFVRGEKIKTVENNGSTISFNNIPFTAAGVYYMVAVEDASSMGGITTDSTEYHITVEVEKYVASDGVTQLRIVQGYPVVMAFGTAENVGADGLNFNNIYTVTGAGDVTIGGEKELKGRNLVAEEFTIGLYADEACTDLIESVTNKADGTFAFSTIHYTPADLGENLTEKTYTYFVKEISGNKGGVKYDGNAYKVTVKVSHEDGRLVVKASDNATKLKIENSYEAKSVSVTIRGSKVLSGDWSAVANKDFTFLLYKADSSFTITDTEPYKTATVTGAESFSISMRYSDGKEGTYYYVLKEDTSASAGGVGYDAGEYHITVSVSDPGDGQLVATKTIYRPGSGTSSTAVFTNAYTVEPTQIILEGSKSYKHGLTGEDLPMTDEMFSFVVLESDDLVATGYNLASGQIVFTPIRYAAAGVHTYTVVEDLGDAGGVEYDQRAFTVTVTVADNGNGTLTATADYGAKPLVFENTYDYKSAQVTFNGEKRMNGDWSAVNDANKVFTFEMYETGEDFVISGAPIDTHVGGFGAYSFGAQTYTAQGTYHYVILEAAGLADKGIAYAENRYHITVQVDDDGAGQLIPTVTVVKGEAYVTADNGTKAAVTVSGLNFTNKYEASPAQYNPVAQKIYEGDEMKEFDFVLTVDGNKKQTKQNNGNTIVFDTLFFQDPGVYELTIREQENTLLGLIRWDRNVYTITLYVEDNGVGQLFVNETKTTITSEKGTDDLTFRNTHHSIITKKDVVVPGAESISIDGSAVEKGDVLLYKVSYTNYDSIPVDVDITDAIPNYTEYVPGSADFGGVLEGKTLKWTVRNVLPGSTATVSFKVKVVAANIAVVNQATVLEGENTYQTNRVSNSVEEDKVIKDVFAPANETVSIDRQKVEVGDELLYKITYTNSDDFDAVVTITDVIPQYSVYVDGSASHGGVFAENKLTWTVELGAGESVTVSFKVTVVETNITVFNQASALEGENILLTNMVRNPVSEDSLVKDVFAPVDETVSIDGQQVQVGQELLYKLTYTNADGFDGTVAITDHIPAYTTYVDGSADHGGVFADGQLTWVADLGAGESITVSFKVTVNASGIVIENQASAVEGENRVDSNMVWNHTHEETLIKDVFAPSEPTVSIDGEQVQVGSELLYKITYTNGLNQQIDLTITDLLPANTVYVENSADFGGVLLNDTITWELTLGAFESVTVSFKVKAAVYSAEILNQAQSYNGFNTLDSNVVSNTTPTPSTNPDTGDNADMALWFAIMAASAMALVVLLLNKKRLVK